MAQTESKTKQKQKSIEMKGEPTIGLPSAV